MKISVVEKIQSLSIKWKLLIPFLSLALIGTLSLSYIGLTSQQRLIREEEKKVLLHHYLQFLNSIHQKSLQALSLATMVAEIPEVQQYLEERNRQALIELLLYTYVRLKMDFEIEQFHFHIPPATSFLRLHYLERFGEDMSAYRKTIVDAIRTGEPTAGLEWGDTGFGIRGVVPVYRFGKIVGSVEIGHSFGEAFLDDFHKSWGVDLTLYRVGGPSSFSTMGRAGKWTKSFDARTLEQAVTGKPTILIAPKRFPDRSILIGPVRAYGGQIAALVEINMDRSHIRARLIRTRNIMVVVGLTGTAVSFLITFLVTILFTRPIKDIVRHAQEIAQEKRESKLELRPMDEIGALTQALNVMLEALVQRRREIEQYAAILEQRVRERTLDLVESEEKYRTLVENVPLIVYRILPDGTTEFINSRLTEFLGYDIEEAVGDRDFWRDKICGYGTEMYRDICETCFKTGEECRIERIVKHRDGRFLTFIDHAIPAKDAGGRIRWIDGIMMDITEIKRLQEKALRTEEIRLLGEISAHMAHEIRNPLISAGGFARRLRDSLPEEDPKRQLAHIIVEEVARLENYMKILVSLIQPFDLVLTEVNVEELLESLLDRLQVLLREKGLELIKHLPHSTPWIQGDEEKLNKAFESLLRHAIVSTPRGEKLYLSTRGTTDRLFITLKHRVHRLSEDDLEKFFFPHIDQERERSVPDLPFARIVIHRHGGTVNLEREGKWVLIMRIEFPVMGDSG
ncbi:MAG: PAS domain S-box protein [Deltaproteobacteria bacterium]|nr:PAS domain S-box protein [Deltaproteobacteria bacterium]MBW2015647.1 PAS domain S-box protein [Deltaproteobacteria bacterium]MBW2128354.1 PAS domain S-box protein [Deltaproteobacteria bacterium]MBW2302508.1 PAS domain S-box protein [Deltaproteobacteria bacterium]